MTEVEKPSEVEQLRAEARDTDERVVAYKAHIKSLEETVEALEADVARLEAEGLKPLVDRMKVQITALKKLVIALATAIDELIEEPVGGGSDEAS